MTAYFIRRILLIIPTFLGITLLVLSLIHISEPTRLESKSRFPS